MRDRMKRTLAAVALGAAGLAMTGGTAAAEQAISSDWYPGYQSWNDPQDDGGVSFYEGEYKNVSGGKVEYVKGYFKAYGETLTISDFHKNGRSAVVRLWVGDSGPAVFYGDGDGTERKVPLSYDEGQTVQLEVCTSDSPNAVCSPKKAKGVT